MYKCFLLVALCPVTVSATAMTLEEQYSGLRDCSFDGVYYDQNKNKFGPKAFFFNENKDKLSVCWQSDGITSFCIKGPVKFYGLDVKELTLSSSNNGYFGVVFLNDERSVIDVLSKHFNLDVADNVNKLPSIDILPEDGYARIYCNLYNVMDGDR